MTKIESNRIEIVGSVLEEKHTAFTKPLNSDKLKIFASNGNMHNELSTFDLDSIVSKMMYLPYKDSYIFIPILHTMDSLSLRNQST